MIEQDSLEYSFELITPNSTELNYKLTKEYFKEGKFKSEENFFQLEFKQGSKLKNGLVLNPLKWKIQFQITFDNNLVFVKGLVDPSNQFVSQAEINCWNRFITNFKNSLLQRKNLFILNKEFVKTSKKSTLSYISYGIVLTVLLLVIIGFTADYFKLSLTQVVIPSSAITAIVIFLIQRKMNQNKIS
nr:hypothetical protein BACY1_18740 [Tenacibaculum mesophilum]